jgi:hypothetical protein
MLARCMAFAIALAVPATADDAPASEPLAKAEACLAEAVYFEARGTSATARAAVAYVVVNRTEDPDFPASVCAVVKDSCQFSYQCDGRSETLKDQEDRAAAYATAEEVLEGRRTDPTAGALYFHREGLRPPWSKVFHRTARIGGHVFYTDDRSYNERRPTKSRRSGTKPSGARSTISVGSVRSERVERDRDRIPPYEHGDHLPLYGPTYITHFGQQHR